MSADLSPFHDSQEIANYATLWAKLAASPVVYRELLIAGRPDLFGGPSRLSALPTALFQAAQVDVACVPMLAAALDLPLVPELLSLFCQQYFPALLRHARAELLDILADPKHSLLDEDTWEEAWGGLARIEELLRTLLPLPSTCQAPAPGHPVALDRRKVIVSIADYQAAEQKRCWMVCLACGELFRTYEGLSVQSVHEQPRPLLVLAFKELFSEWLGKKRDLPPEERAAARSALDGQGVLAAVAALAPARQGAWEAYLQLVASLAADHWAFGLNAVQTSAGGWELLPEPRVCWRPED